MLTLAFLIFAAAFVAQEDAYASDRGVQVAQSGCMSLSQAIEQIRRQTGGKILSAKTRVQGGREVHHIKVLINDKQVKTYTIAGCARSR